MSRETENTLLLLVGISTAMVTLSGAFTRYVKPSMHPWLLAAAVVLIALSAVSIVRDIRRGAGVKGDHVHRPGLGWLLLIPIALLAFIIPPAIGPSTARPAVTDTASEVLRRPFPPLPPTSAPEVSLPDVLIRIAQDTAGTLDHRFVSIRGFTMKDGDRVDLGRVVILCCAADAQLARIHLDGPAADAAAKLPEGSWVRVEGEVPVGQSNAARRSVPSIEITQLSQIQPPANGYSY